MKLLIIALLSLSLIPISYAKTIELTTNPAIDYNFTKDYPLTFNNGFAIDKKSIKPFISFNNQETKTFNYQPIIKDNKYQWEFGFNHSIVAKIDYIGFDISNMKRLDDISFTDGKIRLIFDDLINKGELKIINDSRIILYDPITSVIDPIIELLPNTTNKAYKNETVPFTCSQKWNIFTEFTNDNYKNSNTSNNVRYTQVLSYIKPLGPRCSRYKFTFNVTQYGIAASQITEVKFIHEGYFHFAFETGGVGLFYLNTSSNTWVYYQELDVDVETTIIKTFGLNNTNFNHLIDSTGLIQMGLQLSTVNLDAVTSYTDLAKINITIQEPIDVNLTLNGTQGNKYYLNNSMANFTITSNVSAYAKLTANITNWVDKFFQTPFSIFTDRKSVV